MPFCSTTLHSRTIADCNTVLNAESCAFILINEILEWST